MHFASYGNFRHKKSIYLSLFATLTRDLVSTASIWNLVCDTVRPIIHSNTINWIPEINDGEYDHKTILIEIPHERQSFSFEKAYWIRTLHYGDCCHSVERNKRFWRRCTNILLTPATGCSGNWSHFSIAKLSIYHSDHEEFLQIYCYNSWTSQVNVAWWKTFNEMKKRIANVVSQYALLTFTYACQAFAWLWQAQKKYIALPEKKASVLQVALLLWKTTLVLPSHEQQCSAIASYYQLSAKKETKMLFVTGAQKSVSISQTAY